MMPLLPALFFAAAAATTPAPYQRPDSRPIVVVSDDGKGDFTSLQEALAAARPGDRIVVLPGHYQADLALDRRIEIVIPKLGRKSPPEAKDPESRKTDKELPADTLKSSIDDEEKVDPVRSEIVLTFPEPMDTSDYTLGEFDSPEDGIFPELMGEPSAEFRDPTTFVIHVKLEPGQHYAIGLNTEEERGFKTADGIPLEVAALTFDTAERSMADMESFMQMCREATPENFTAIQRWVVNDPEYDPDSRELPEVLRLIEANKLDEARALLMKGMPNLMISPRANLYDAMISDKKGNKKETEFAGHVARQCVRGLLTTGDGTEEKPIRVTRSTDEYDLIELHFDTKAEKQTLIERDGRFLDKIDCENGKAYWFDATLPMTRRK